MIYRKNPYESLKRVANPNHETQKIRWRNLKESQKNPKSPLKILFKNHISNWDSLRFPAVHNRLAKFHRDSFKESQRVPKESQEPVENPVQESHLKSRFFGILHQVPQRFARATPPTLERPARIPAKLGRNATACWQFQLKASKKPPRTPQDPPSKVGGARRADVGGARAYTEKRTRAVPG